MNKPEDKEKIKAGRPRLGTERRKQRQLTIPDTEYDALKVIGNGNASAGVSLLLDNWHKTTRTD